MSSGPLPGAVIRQKPQECPWVDITHLLFCLISVLFIHKNVHHLDRVEVPIDIGFSEAPFTVLYTVG